MPLLSSPASVPDVSTRTASTPHAATLTSAERWAAWEARGDAHDRAVRRKLAIAAPILALAAAILYALLGR